MGDANLAWADWLRAKRWEFWATGKFGALSVSEAYAQQAVREWLSRLERIRAEVYAPYVQPGQREKPRVYAAYVLEHGPLRGGIHAHLLVGGLGSHPGVEPRARAAWHHGHMHLVRYDAALDPVGHPTSGAAAYLRKTPDAEIQLVGKLKKYRQRTKRA